MKLNAHIVQEELSKKFNTQRIGPVVDELNLDRPRFFDMHLKGRSECIFITCSDMLPISVFDYTPEFLICVGDVPPALVESNIPILLIRDNVEWTHVFNLVQELFDRYDDWDAQLRQILENDADIAQMALSSSSIFDNRVTITDKNLVILARTNLCINDDGSCYWDLSQDVISADLASQMQDLYWGHRSQTEPYLHDDEGRYGGTWVYSINLFIDGDYEGCASLSASSHPFRPGDQVLFQHFANYVRKALERRLQKSAGTAGSLRGVMKDFLNGIPVDERRLEYAQKSLQQKGISKPWQCLCLQSAGGLQPLPIDYLCTALMDELPNSIPLAYNDRIVLLLHFLKNENDRIHKVLDQFLTSMEFHVGISNPFFDFHQLRVFYRQACCALEIGIKLEPMKTAFRFSEMALPHLLSRCREEFSPEELMPPGMHKLRELSLNSAVDYWNTLFVYLENEMNAVKTAKKLHLHRSTMLQRLAKIRNVIGDEIDTADGRLYYRLCFHIVKQYLNM